MEEVTSEEDEVYIIFDSKVQDFFESVDRILSTDGITFKVPNVVIGREQDTDSILGNLEM